MFGWRRRSEGFEWQEYVRTTVLVRRADRQRKIDDVRVAAVNKVKDTADRGVAAGRAGVEHVAETSSQIAMTAARAVGAAIATAAIAVWAALTFGATAAARGLQSAGLAVWRAIAALPWGRLAVPALPWGAWRERIATAVKLPSRDPSKPRPDVGFKLPVSGNALAGGAIVIALIFLVGPMLNGGSALTPAKFEPKVAASPAARAPMRASAEQSDSQAGGQNLAGRATVVSAGVLKINRTVVKLAGIEAPDPNQRCATTGGRAWNCSASARDALERIVRRRTVVCTPTETSADGQIVASCTADEADIADTLVRNGYVFALSGFFATYGGAENEARAAKIGVWQGDGKRPEEWRREIWEDAKRVAPDGCPIKGRVRGNGRSYTMPWSPGYDSSRLQTVRGDRWFCTEADAQAAGFKLADRS